MKSTLEMLAQYQQQSAAVRDLRRALAAGQQPTTAQLNALFDTLGAEMRKDPALAPIFEQLKQTLENAQREAESTPGQKASGVIAAVIPRH